jgi:hypothetical protein
MGNVGNGIWPPPRIRYLLRTEAFASSTAAAASAFCGYPVVAGILAATAAALLLIDIIGGQ